MKADDVEGFQRQLGLVVQKNLIIQVCACVCVCAGVEVLQGQVEARLRASTWSICDIKKTPRIAREERKAAYNFSYSKKKGAFATPTHAIDELLFLLYVWV